MTTHFVSVESEALHAYEDAQKEAERLRLLYREARDADAVLYMMKGTYVLYAIQYAQAADNAAILKQAYEDHVLDLLSAEERSRL